MSKKVAIFQNGIIGGGRIRVILSFVEVLNEMGITPDILTLGLSKSEDELKEKYNKREVNFKVRIIPRYVKLPGELEAILMNLLMHKYTPEARELKIPRNEIWSKSKSQKFEKSSGETIKVLFIGSLETSGRIYGTQIDFELLNKYFKVRTINLQKLKKSKSRLSLAFEMFKGVLWADLTFSWFAGYHAYVAVLLSKILTKKSIVVASGHSVANMPEIEYGQMQSSKSARMVKFILKNADKVLAVSEFNKKEILKYTTPKNVELVYHGVDYSRFTSKNDKEDLVITVGHVSTSNLKRKGLETFVKSAKYLPNIEFVLVGKHVDDSIDYLKSIATPNVKFAGFVSNDKLLKYYHRAKVYVQVSAHEGFGLSLAEAMLCKCVPVVTDKAAIPEVVGDTGFYVPYDDEKATAEAIKEALNSDKGKEARERIKNMYLIQKRERDLIDIVKGLVDVKK